MRLIDIRIDGGTQPRSEINEGAVRDYAEALSNGVEFPPVIVFHDGKDYWLADGFHRWHAHRHAGIAEIRADLKAGTRRDAVLFAIGANATHGLQRTNADKRRAVEMLLADTEWAAWSDHEIARRAAVSHAYVGRIRRSLETFPVSEAESAGPPDAESSDKQARTFTTKHGTVSTMRTGGINADRQSPEDPEAQREAVAQVEGREQPRPAPKQPRPKPAADGEVEALRARVADLEEQVAALSRELDVATRENIAMGEAFDADDKLAVLHRQNAMLRETNRGLQSRLDGEISTNSELKREITRALRKIERLEKGRG